MEEILELDIDGIKDYIKIRYPMLMLDFAKVLPGKRAEGYKLLSYNEQFWQGHYPDYPMMPGSYQLEALSQMFSLIFLTVQDQDKEKIPKLVGFENVRFFKEVKPGEIFYIKAELQRLRHGYAKGEAKGYVKDELVCSAEIKMMHR